MSQGQLDRDHMEIAAFTRSRIFSAIDDFEAAREMCVDAGTGVFILLTQRLARNGHDPEFLSSLAHHAATNLIEKNSAPPSAMQELSANVVHIHRR